MRRWCRAIPAALLIASLGGLFLSRGGETLPLYAARTGNMCQTCHFDPNGGGPRNDFGFSFARNRHSLNAEDSTSPWHDLSILNRIGENMPVYIGVNQRFMLLANNAGGPKGLDRLGFFNMENALHFAFQPHQRLTLVYSVDAFASGADSPEKTRDAFGMISGFPGNGYLKAGRFRTPFGLRMDDHTVATRNSFLDFSTADHFLPYDPRFPDMGIEYGMDNGSWFGRAAFTNGDADLFGGQFAETKTIKLGYNHPFYQGAVSFYDNFQKNPNPGQPKRATRWGYYGMTHTGPVALLGEIAAGTDEAQPVVPGHVSGTKRNLLAGFGEIDYAPVRWFNLRGRYDYVELGRSFDVDTHRRYSVEADYVPVPFAELRGAVRRIDHQNEHVDDETQGFLQFHFSF